MPLDYSHQMGVLKDILSDHQLDCCGTASECAQVGRLIESMLANSTTNERLKDTLHHIYAYTQTAKDCPDLNQHIHTNQQNLSQWVNELSTLS
ncbi:YtzH-like family protein [Priestia koreensis]|uniref:YtzH-like family protein n=1 Tax=Priestia koreensis TaxID=284581 RepID=UPI001F5A1AEB|nr:YtzH-like family protein [Priestia koreensis]MCM3002842.1 YtzH-like family protein [Priestia koreensis]UNL84531.1 YtzH-like family protein [Priestia koreensis]